MFVLFTLLKLTLDECKTLTKISTHNLSQQFPQTSAHFGHDKIRNKKTGKKHLASIPEEASCIKLGKASCKCVGPIYLYYMVVFFVFGFKQLGCVVFDED